jgi:hypothetical protein
LPLVRKTPDANRQTKIKLFPEETLMRKAAIPILVLLLSASLAHAVQVPDWIDYNSAEGRYTVSLPTQPKLSTQESATADGQKFLQYMATAQEPTAVYLIGYFDHVAGTTFSADRARDGMVAAVKGTLVSERTISVNGYPGRELKVGTSTEGTDYIILVKFYDTDSRVYVQQVIFPKSFESEAMNAKAAKYFDSFQILKK